MKGYSFTGVVKAHKHFENEHDFDVFVFRCKKLFHDDELTFCKIFKSFDELDDESDQRKVSE